MRLLIGVILSGILVYSGLSAQETELIISNGDIKIAGSLRMASKQAGPLVIFISGSGAQNRDEEIFGFKPFKVMANHLAEQGISSFRYDDRGVGKSTGTLEDTSLEALAGDVHAIVDELANSTDYEFSEIILLGHSQGGVVALKTAAENRMISKVVLMASSLVPLKEVINEQVRLMQRAMGKTEQDIATVLAFQEQVYETVRTNSGWDRLKEAYKELIVSEINKLPEAQRASIVDVDAFADAQFKAQVEPMKAPIMKSLLFYDPANDLEVLKIPVFALFGGKDMQVTIPQNYEVFNQICREQNMDCTTQIYNDANHLFQKANTGLPGEYAMLPKQFVDGFLSDISEWIVTGF